MKITIYIKQEVDSLSGLPKEGKFYAHQKIYRDDYITRFDFKTPHRKLWKNQIDWYLQPIELELPEDDEIRNKAFDLFHLKGEGEKRTGVRVGMKVLRDKIKSQLKIDE